MTTTYATNIQEEVITFIIFNPDHPHNLQQFTAHKDDLPEGDWETLRDGLLRQDIDPDEAVRICSYRERFSEAIKQADNNLMGIHVNNGRLFFNGEECRNSLSERVLELFRKGLPIEPWVRFAEKVYRNPRPWVADELDLWLAASDLPITPDGDIIAYKKVRGDYKDIYSGTMDNSPGRVVQVPEEIVDTDRNNTCSVGLHFCSKSYLPHFGSDYGNRVVLVKINPEHIVSIPNDYDNAKGRTWRYEVVGEIDPEYVHKKKWEPVVMEYGTPQTATILSESNDRKTGPKIQRRRVRDIEIPGVGFWPASYSYSYFEDWDLEDKLHATEENGVISIVIDDEDIDQESLKNFFANYILDWRPGRKSTLSDFTLDWEPGRFTLRTKDRHEALMIAYWMARFDPKRPLLSKNRHQVVRSQGVDKILQYVERVLSPSIKVQWGNDVAAIHRRGRSTNDPRWKLVLALLSTVEAIENGEAEKTVLGNTTCFTHRDPNGNHVTIGQDLKNFGVALLHEGDEDNPEQGRVLSINRFLGITPNPDL